MNQVNNNPLLSARILDWVSNSIGNGAVIENVNLLPGSTSSSLYSMEITYQTKKMALVLRLLDNTPWLQEEPDLALHEAESLKWAYDAELPAPQLIAFDPKGEYCGIPAVLMSKLPGSVVLQPNHMAQWLQEMAAFLVRLHELEAGSFSWKYFTYNEIKQLTIPEWSSFPAEWGKVIRILLEERPKTVDRFIHRDFHPANVLWLDNKVSGIVDWINACRGPAGIDIGHCRLNLALLHGVETADQFLKSYLSLAGDSAQYEPYWDLITLIEFLPGPPSVYKGWIDFGMTNLNDDIIKERYEQYMLSILERFITRIF